MKELAGLSNLTELNLWGTQITDAGLLELSELKNLTTLHIWKVQITDAGVQELKDSLPQVWIFAQDSSGSWSRR